MADFRRYVLALVLLALFAGLASAQVGVPTGPALGQQMSCVATAGSTSPLRSEGFTELIGDITLTCTGGTNFLSASASNPIPTANITIFLNTQVTSRLLPNAATAGVNASEALLLIDEPGSGLAGYGPTQPQTPAPNPAVGAGPTGATQCSQVGPGAFSNVVVMTPCSSFPSVTAPNNVYQGVVNGSTSSGNVTGTSVTFNGVPILPPVTAGVSRVFRMTNIRVNASALTGFGQPVVANVAITGLALGISNPTLTVGFVQSSLTTAVKTASGGTPPSAGVNFNQCSSQSLTNTGAAPIANNIQFTDNFAGAFKTRVNPNVTGQATGQSNALVQNIPGTLYNGISGTSESGFTLTVGGGAAGLADYGTRLKAAFNNIPSGVTIWVTSVNTAVNNAATPFNAGTGGVGVSGGVPPTSSSPFAELVASETISDNGFFPVTATNLPTTTANGVTIVAGVVALTPNAAGTAVATWEVVNTNPAAVETFNFGVYITYTASVNTSPASPAPGSITVNLSYAPTPTQGAFTAAQGPSSNNLPIIPRFLDTSTAVNAINIVVCRTVLMFPFAAAVGGFDTGLAIEDTSADPFGTKIQTGTCTLYFDGQTAAVVGPPAIPGPFTTAVVTPTTPWSAPLSTLPSALGFDGYIIAICNFQFAHGFAFVGQLGNATAGGGYVALVVPDPATTTNGRSATAAGTGVNNAEMLDQ